jgi:hypothetical protein
MNSFKFAFFFASLVGSTIGSAWQQPAMMSPRNMDMWMDKPNQQEALWRKVKCFSYNQNLIDPLSNRSQKFYFKTNEFVQV